MRHASLFSGIGGSEVAAAMLGWENVFHCEINPFGRSVLEYWFPNSDSYEDITKTDFMQYRGKIDILTGGFPCQPFSTAGRRRGDADDRYLWHEMLRVIDQVRPMWVIGENVNGILTMVESCEVAEVGSESSLFGEGDGIHIYRAEQPFTIERICRDLESKGYSVQPMCIPSCAVGAPHRRDRIFILAYNVADTEGGIDLRESRADEGKGKEERVSERNSVWQLGGSGNVRPEAEGLAEDSLRDGCEFGFEKIKGDKRNIGNTSTGDSKRICREARTFLSNSSCKGLEGQDEPKCKKERERMHIWRDTPRCGGQDEPWERWRGFPSVSPIHRGNDGIPFDVDNLTIPFSKWRNESIKAYGNAIVPQVMYRIFQCIEKITDEARKKLH